MFWLKKIIEHDKLLEFLETNHFSSCIDHVVTYPYSYSISFFFQIICMHMYLYLILSNTLIMCMVNYLISLHGIMYYSILLTHTTMHHGQPILNLSSLTRRLPYQTVWLLSLLVITVFLLQSPIVSPNVDRFLSAATSSNAIFYHIVIFYFTIIA